MPTFDQLNSRVNAFIAKTKSNPVTSEQEKTDLDREYESLEEELLEEERLIPTSFGISGALKSTQKKRPFQQLLTKLKNAYTPSSLPQSLPSSPQSLPAHFLQTIFKRVDIVRLEHEPLAAVQENEDEAQHNEDDAQHNEDDAQHNEDDAQHNEDDAQHNEDDAQHNEDDAQHNEDDAQHNEDDAQHNEDEAQHNEDDAQHNEDEAQHNEDDAQHNEDDAQHNEDEAQDNEDEAPSDADQQIIGALQAEITRLTTQNEKANNGLFSCLFHNPKHQEKLNAVIAAATSIKNDAKAITDAINDPESALYNALNMHTSQVFTFNVQGGMSWKARALLNMQQAIVTDDSAASISLT